jgi:hypothetical protein
VVSSSGLIPQDNAEGFHMVWSLLEDLIHLQDLSLCAFGLELVAEMVPEFGFGNDFVSCE